MSTISAHVMLVLVTALLIHAVRCESNAGLNATQQFKYFGYPVEIHEAITSDGYILELHRIPFGRSNKSQDVSSATGKPIVFIQHGVFCTSGVFGINYRDKSLPYILADLGYDVWLGNSRGTPFSMRHVFLDEKRNKEQYWNFTVTELSVNDLSASFDYIFKKTGQSNLQYIGHSQGNIVVFVLLAERPEYNQKVRVVSLAPISYFKHFPDFPVRVLLRICNVFQPMLYKLGIYKVGLDVQFATKIQHTFPFLYEIVYFALFGGASSEIFDKSLFPAFAPSFGGFAAVKVAAHFDQLHKSGRLGYYNYGKQGNLAAYGQEDPPDYNIKGITAPLAIFYAQHDYLVSKKDLLHFASQLPNLVYLKEMPYKHYSHLDFLWSKTVNEDVYNKVVELLQN